MASESVAKSAARDREVGANHRAHHKSATRFHFESAESRRVSEASARSFARTCSGLSLGPNARLKRTGSASRSPGHVAGAYPLEERQQLRATPMFGRRAAKTRDPGAEKTVADQQVMVEKAERPIGRECRQPE